MNLSEKLIYARKKAGMSQIDLADEMGVSRQSVSKWETGESNPDINKLSQLAKVLNVTTDWLLSDSDVVNPFDADETDFTSSARQAQTVNNYPDWLNHLPGFIMRGAKRFGWLSGIYIALGGIGMLLLGVLTRVVSKIVIFGSVSSNTIDNSFGMDPMLYPGNFAELTKPMVDMQNNAWTIFSIFSWFMIGIGLVVILLGLIVSIALKKWGQKNEL